MNSLVIEQGTLLDRIDFNIENTQSQVKSANLQLVKVIFIHLFIYLFICLFIYLIIYLI